MNFNSLLVILSLSSLLLVLGVNGVSRNDFSLDPKTISKTIETEDGEVIDCVDIYKQPAFSHPQLANHTLQMKPSSYPAGYEPKSTSPADNYPKVNFQKWHKNGEYCPEGTIPIVRTPEKYFHEKKRHPMSKSSPSTNTLTPQGYEVEFAVAYFPGTEFHGVIGDINTWNPKVLEKEVTGAQFWVTDGAGADTDSIEAGWTVTTLYNEPTLFIYYTADAYKTGCYNLGCPGFVQTNNKVALGAFLGTVSNYDNATQLFINIMIYRDDKDGNWWFHVQGEDVGYWPPSLFHGGLKGPASLVEAGGEVVNSEPGGLHTTTQMGSGHFPSEGFGKAASFKSLKYISDAGREVRDADGLTGHATRPECYDIILNPEKWYPGLGFHFYYGGPGYSPNCQR